MGQAKRIGVEAVALSLESRILGGWAKAEEALPSVREIGHLFGCSALTAHRAMRLLVDKGYVDALPRQGYRVAAFDVAHRAPSSTATIAFLEVVEDQISWLGDIHRHQVMALQQEAMRRNWTSVLVPCRGQSPAEMERQLRRMGATALILQDLDRKFTPEFIAAMIQSRRPVVSLDPPGSMPGMDHVLRDEAQGAALAAEYLMNRGHRSIGWHGLAHSHDGGRRRFEAAAHVLKQANVAFEWQGLESMDEMESMESARRFLERKPRPTAVLALWQSAAQTLAQAARERSIEVGKDLDIVGWRMNEEHYANTTPELLENCASVTWSLAEVARTLFNRIGERLRDPELPPACILLPMKLREPGDLADAERPAFLERNNGTTAKQREIA